MRRRKPASVAVSGGEGEAAIANHLHDHVDQVSVRQQLQQLAGEAAVPHSVVGCCEVEKHSSGLPFSRKAILDVLYVSRVTWSAVGPLQAVTALAAVSCT